MNKTILDAEQVVRALNSNMPTIAEFIESPLHILNILTSGFISPDRKIVAIYRTEFVGDQIELKLDHFELKNKGM